MVFVLHSFKSDKSYAFTFIRKMNNSTELKIMSVIYYFLQYKFHIYTYTNKIISTEKGKLILKMSGLIDTFDVRCKLWEIL